MSDFYDAFQELKGLDEATFSFDKPGILALKKYINDDGEEETTTITVTDPSAETVDDMKDDYDGEVILKCSICGGLISKEPSQVKVDEQTQLANVEEECPYCYNVGGYEVIGEIHSPEENVDVDVTVNDDDTLEVDSDNITVENKSMTEGLNEDVSVDKLAKFIENAVEGLKAGEGTNYRYKFDDRFALFVGWSEGYDEDDDTVIHSEEDPEFAIVAGIKVWTSDDMWTDFDWLNSPYLENGDVIDDSMTISPEEDYRRLAQDFLDDYNDDYRDLKVTKDGLVVEHDDEEEAPYRITYYYDDSFDYDNSDTETYDTFAEVKDVFNSRRGDVFAIEVENNDGEVILSYSKGDAKNESLTEGVKDWRSNVIEFPNGEYVYVAVEDGKLIAGGATNTGIFHDYEMDIDGEEPTDAELQDMYDMIVDKHPEYLEESCKKGKRKKIDESVKIISTLDEYTPWSGAKDTYETIVDAGKIDDFDAYLEDSYPEGLTVTELNDLLWFDGDSVLRDLGIYTEEAIDIAIQEVVEEAQDERFEDTDDLKSFLEINLEKRVHAIVDVDVYDGEVEITIEDTSRSFALTDFTVEEIEESLKEAKEVVEFDDSLNESRSNSYTRVKGVEAEWYEKSTRNYNYEYVDLTIDGEKAMGKDRWMNRPWYKFTFANAFMDAAYKLGYYEEAKEAVDSTSSIEEAVRYFAEHYKEEEELTESVDNIQITTDSDVANIDLNGSDTVNVSISPKDDGGDEEFVGDITDEPTIQPLDGETQEEIETNSEEKEQPEDEESSGEETTEEEVDEFDETDFDELGESYLKSVYNNVDSFKTTGGYLDKDRIKLEGIISFKSGKKAKTSFVFEGYSKTSRGKYKMIGENLQLTNRKNAFILTGIIKDRKLCLESLTYRYSAKDAKSGKSVRVYGTKRVK